MRERVRSELERLVATTRATEASWVRAAAGADGPIVADVVRHPEPERPGAEGTPLCHALVRPLARWSSALVDACEALGANLPWQLAVRRRDGLALVMSDERRVFGAIVLGGSSRCAAARHAEVVSRSARRVMAWVAAAESWPSTHLLVDGDRRVLYGGPHADAWREELGDAPLSGGLRRGVRIDEVAMHGPSGIARLLRLGPPPPLLRAADAPLSVSQRRVAEYAAAGATVPEIARTLASSRETVRTHLREVYRRLGVCSRVELVHALGAPRTEPSSAARLVG